MKLDVHVYIHNGGESEIIHLLKHILRTMVTKQDFDAAFAQINEATNNIADDITRLTNQLGAGGLSPDEQAAALTELQGVADKLKQIAAVTPEPPATEQPAA